MIRDAARRIALGPLLALVLLLIAVVLPVAILFGRLTYAAEAGSAASCLLNAITGGPRTITYSAWSWQRHLQGKPWATARVRLVDALNLAQGHCEAAWESHCARGLITPPTH